MSDPAEIDVSDPAEIDVSDPAEIDVSDPAEIDVSDPAEIVDNADESRFEFRADGRLAELVYRRHGKRLVLIHTGVPPELERHGIGGALVAAAIDLAARDDLTLVPLCPFARSWLEQHPDEASRVVIDWDR